MPLTPKHPTIEAVETIIQYSFNHTALLWEALQCSGIAFDSEGQTVPPGGNKRLAIIGDAVLRLALAEDWYKGSDTTGKRIQQKSSSSSSFLGRSDQKPRCH